MVTICRASVVAFLIAVAFLATLLIFAIPPSSHDLLPTFLRAWESGFYPDGLKLRRSYTGFSSLDHLLAAYGGFFATVVDGKDPATHLFCLWFLPQLLNILVFTYWEASRGAGLVKFPTLVCMLAQLLTAGVVLPLYLAFHVLSLPPLPSIAPGETYSKARTIFPAIMLGFGLPSLPLLLAPSGISPDTLQLITAWWQPFPIYIAFTYWLLHLFDKPASHQRVYSRARCGSVEQAYLASGLISGLVHTVLVTYTALSSQDELSFAQVFIPRWIVSYLPLQDTKSTMLPHRIAVRLLLQHDWLTMTIAVYIYFAWSEQARGRKAIPFLVKSVLLTIIGGPGVAVAWAAIRRERDICACASRKAGKTE